MDQRFGASVWTSGSYDPNLNLVYFGTGNTYDVATLLQPHPEKGASNDGLYTDSTVALDPDTGKLAWYYQHMNRDVWDLDWAFEQLLITLPVDGEPTDLVVTGGKMAVFDAVDRANGKYEFSKDLGLAKFGDRDRSENGKENHQSCARAKSQQDRLHLPQCEWREKLARRPPTILPLTFCMCHWRNLAWTIPGFPSDAAQTAAGGLDIRFTLRPRPDSDGKMGRIEADKS